MQAHILHEVRDKDEQQGEEMRNVQEEGERDNEQCGEGTEAEEVEVRGDGEVNLEGKVGKGDEAGELPEHEFD